MDVFPLTYVSWLPAAAAQPATRLLERALRARHPLALWVRQKTSLVFFLYPTDKFPNLLCS